MDSLLYCLSVFQIECNYNKARTSTIKLSEAGKIFRFYDLVDIFRK